MASSVLTCALIVGLLIATRGHQLLVDNNSSTTNAEHQHTCPPWTHSNDNDTACLCNSYTPADSTPIKCDNTDPNTLKLLACYCLSHYDALNTTVYGKCMYSCSLKRYHNISYSNSTNARYGCSKHNRTGELCSKCKDGTGYPLYSHKLDCIPCTGKAVTLLLYVVLAYLPLTVFFILVMVFRISANAETLSGYILMSQIITTPAQLRYISSLKMNKYGSVATKIASAALAVWNLDFFRGVYEPFCYHESMSALHIVSLEYLIALYPLCLILLTYVIVYVHDRFPAVARTCRPVHRVLSRMRRQWDIKKSLVDGFTTFLLLSYIKILNASFDLLVPTTLYNMTGHALPNQYYLYYDGGTRGFHSGHTLYGILAISMLLVFNVAPLLMFLLYPCRFFQALLNRLGCSARLQPLHIFMDSFLGCYRTEPRDYRHFAAFSLLVRIGNLVIFSITLSRYYYPFGCALFIGMAVLVTVVKPYKSPAQNTIDAALYLVFAFGYLGVTAYALSPDSSYNTVLLVFMVSSLVTSLMYPVALILHCTVLKSRIPRICCSYFSERESQAYTHNSDEELFQSLKERKNPLLEAAKD